MRLIDADQLLDFIKFDEELIAPEERTTEDIVMMIKCAPTIYPPPNFPLTLDELREMDGEPVWIVHTDYTPFGKEYWGIVRDGFSGLPNCFVATRDENIQLLYSEYGKTWLAYRRKPEKGEDNA